MRIVYRIIYDKSVLAHASVCSYTTILSLVPIIAISLAMITAFTTTNETDFIGAVQQTEGVQPLSFSNQVFDFFFEHFVPGAAEGAREELIIAKNDILTFIQRTRSLRFVILLFLILACISLYNSIEHSFNEIWSVQHRRTLYTRFLAFWLLVTLTPLLLGLSYYYTSIFLSSKTIVTWQQREWVVWLLPYLVSYFFTLSAFLFANRYLPNVHVRLFPAFLGSALSAFLWETAKVSFDMYITYATIKTQGYYTVFFGTYSVIVIFIVWLYYSYLCFLIGPVIATTIQDFHQHESRLRRKNRRSFHRPVHSIEIFLDICRNFRESKHGTSKSTLEQLTGWTPNQLSTCLRELEHSLLVHQDYRTKDYYPSVAPEQINVKEMIERLVGLSAFDSYTRKFNNVELKALLREYLTEETRTPVDLLNIYHTKQEQTEPYSTADSHSASGESGLVESEDADRPSSSEPTAD